jgi:hypothetical protein
MLFTPAYIFTLLLGIWVLSLAGCIALGIFSYRLIVDRGRLLLRLERLMTRPSVAHVGGLAKGAYLSDVALPLLSQATSQPREEVALSDVITSAGQPQLLVFLDSECLYSRALVRELQANMPRPERPAIIAVIGGDPTDPQALPADFGVLFHDPYRQAAPLYGVQATPAGYLVTPTRHTASALQVGPEALLHVALTGSARDLPSNPLPTTPIPRNTDRNLPPLAAGDAAPDLALTSVEGAPWFLADQRGDPLTLLFVDPDCPPCQEVLEQYASCTRAGIVVISQGPADELINAMSAAFSGATLLLQTRREATHAFRMLETPALYEVDDAGMISAGPIIGRQHVFRHLADGICRDTLPGTSAI